MTKKIRLLIVDDSRLIRMMINSIVSSDPYIDVIGEASDPYEAREKIKALSPDVVTLDVEMPKMDGLSFLEKIMSLHPIPVIMVSTLTQKGTDVTLRALEIGAVDYVSKPDSGDLTAVGSELISKIKVARWANIRQKNYNEQKTQRQDTLSSPQKYTKKLVAIGSSTGGIESLYDILVRLPQDCPPVVIAQHISKGFSERFALRVNKSCAVHVKEAENGEKLKSGTIYIGQGGRHMTIKKSGADLVCVISEDTDGENYRPSVDKLFCSASETVGKNAVGVILTGMGKDGALGLLTMRKSGAVTLGQDENSCVVYGMPKAAAMAGGVMKQVSLSRMAEEIIASCSMLPEKRVRCQKKMGAA